MARSAGASVSARRRPRRHSRSPARATSSARPPATYSHGAGPSSPARSAAVPLEAGWSSSRRAPAGLRVGRGPIAASSSAPSARDSVGALIEAISERAGVALGVGSNVTQPRPSNHASTQEWASRSRTTHSPWRRRKPPGEKPLATRAGTPPMRSSSAIAPEKCWQ